MVSRLADPIHAASKHSPVSHTTPMADVCLIVEGCYPYRGGGVSVWVHELMRGLPDTRFAVLAIQPAGPVPPSVFERPANLVQLSTLRLGAETDPGRGTGSADISPVWLTRTLRELTGTAPRAGLIALTDLALRLGPQACRALPSSRQAWEAIGQMYTLDAPGSSFLQYYWAWQALFGGLVNVLAAPLPRARAYHAVSTGFAGVLAARAAIQTGRPMLLTEHGIYANERLAEILAAPWITDTIDRGPPATEMRPSLREIWMSVFEGYARLAYSAASEIVTLFPANQELQRELGADGTRMRVIANGIDAEVYAGLAPAPRHQRPTIALIGRVVPIKDVETFIKVVAAVRSRLPDLAAFVLGTTTEDPEYARFCQSLAGDLGLADCLTFTGEVDVPEWLPRLHLLVLTSLSEAQPFSMLEAGAAGIASVVTDVGSCRSLILGEPGGDASLGPGGIVTEPLAVDTIADSVVRLLENHDLRETCGQAMRSRVRTHYRRDTFLATYRDLYTRHAR